MIQRCRRFADQWKDTQAGGILREAANVIEAVTSERDAAIGLLHGTCSACRSYSMYYGRGSCKTCRWKVINDGSHTHNDDNWEWRGTGPMKEDR